MFWWFEHNSGPRASLDMLLGAFVNLPGPSIRFLNLIFIDEIFRKNDGTVNDDQKLQCKGHMLKL